MKALRNYLNKIKPNFEEGGKLHALQSVFDGFETFLFVPNKTAKSGAHIHDAIDSKRIMSMVVLALMPAMLFGMYNVGYQNYLAAGTLASASFWEIFLFGFLAVLPKILVSYIVGLGNPHWLPLMDACIGMCLCRYFCQGDLRRNRYEHLQCCHCRPYVPVLLLSHKDEW